VWYLDGSNGSQLTGQNKTPFPEFPLGGVHVAATSEVPIVRI